MNWLAKINLGTVVQRLGPFKSALLLITIIATCLFCGYRLGNFYHKYQIEVLAQQKSRLAAMYQHQEQQLSRIHTLEVELEVERLANQRSQSLLKSMEKVHYQVKKELAFYEKVMAPEKQADGLVIDSLTLNASESPNHFRFQVALIQQNQKKSSAKGYVEISVVGSFNSKPKVLNISELSSLTKKQLSFSFQYFQIVEGEFTLPEHFIAEQIEIAVVIPKGKWQKYYRLDQTYAWQTLLTNDQSKHAQILD